MKKTSLKTFFAARRGIAIFMASLILLSISILAMGSMTRLSESSQLSGKILQSRKLAINADAASRLALAEITAQFITNAGSPDNMYVNATDTLAGQSQFKVLEAKEFDAANPIPLFAYRAHARLLVIGGMPPGTDIVLSARDSCYDIMIDTREMIRMDTANANIATDLGVHTTSTGAVYHFGQLKSLGMTSCLRKRDN
jgi:hypothetical protein